MKSFKSLYYLFIGVVWINIAAWISLGAPSNDKIIGLMAWTIGITAIVELISIMFKDSK